MLVTPTHLAGMRQMPVDLAEGHERLFGLNQELGQALDLCAPDVERPTYRTAQQSPVASDSAT
ncbi:unannotated protein [freshwater metagenome]|uniref:Unannotated protein n=1 Tax=freshwater metagenome TaxID=449393 RepID=A0A6J7HNY1_9ZZZZ